MQKDSFYFSHDANARKDEKILCLLAEHGYEGYGIYWVLVEMMFENTDTAISRKLLKGIAYDLRIDITLLQSVITTCYDVKLFAANDEKIWSNSLRRRKAEWEEKKKKRSEAGKAGMAARWHSDNIVIKTDNKRITNDNKRKESKVKERKVNNSINTPFTNKFLDHWSLWKEYKKKEHRFFFKSIESEQAALSELVDLSGGIEQTAIEIINQSLSKGWKGLFAIKENGTTHKASSNGHAKPGRSEINDQARANY